MRLSGFELQLTDLVRAEVEGIGLQFWGLTAPAAGKKRVVRIYVDGPEGVTIDDCAKVSRQVGLLLEVEDIIPGAFTLEVSSPGIERKFFSLDQLAGYTDKVIELKLVDPVDNRRKFKGTLKEVDEHGFTLILKKDETMRFDWDAVNTASLVHEF